MFCRLLIFFKIIFFEKLFQMYHKSVKQFVFRSGSKLFDVTCKQRAKVGVVLGKVKKTLSACSKTST